MAFLSLNQCWVAGIVVLVCIVETTQAAGRRTKGKRYNYFSDLKCQNSDVDANISALWNKVNFLSQPIAVHVHEDRSRCDDYFGCDFMNHRTKSPGSPHSHSHGSHSSHKSHKSHKGHKHAHGSHKHGSHSAKSVDHHQHHERPFKDNHIHIHLSVHNKDDCGFVSYAPKDEFVYARCDMVPVKKRNGITGSILMRQKPHGILETKVSLTGFKKASEGVKDGKHDFFFDVHDKADFTDGCASFGAHDHVHHDDGKFDHEHNHSHSHDTKAGHNHDHHDGHGHSVHDHHAHADDWGNVVVGEDLKANMNVNCTHHELYGPESMFGRGIVLHDKEDQAVSCCAITYANIDDMGWDAL